MDLIQQVDEAIKTAMKNKDKDRLSALRGLKSALFNAASEAGDRNAIDDATATKVLQKQLKQRQESAEVYEQQGRTDLAEEEQKQAQVIEAFMPEQMGEEELRKAVQEVIGEVGASSSADMGKVMPEAMKKLGNQADGKRISAVVKELLG